MAKFTAGSAPKLPNLACVGTIAAIADTKASAKGVYNVTNIAIEPNGGGYGAKFSFLSRPEWFTPGFTPDVEFEGNSGAMFVYTRNIQGPPGSGVSILMGLPGTEAKAEALVDDIFASVETIKDADGNSVALLPDAKLDSILRKHTGSIPVGYILKQKQEDTGEVDEKGKKVKIRTSNYELDRLFYADEASLKRYRKLAADRPEDWKVAFDEAF